MGWQDRLPDGMSHVDRQGDDVRFTLELPVDDEGLIPMVCPEDASHEFKAHVETGFAVGDEGCDDLVEASGAAVDESDADDDAVESRFWCPYCGTVRDDVWDFMPEQLAIATEAMSAAMHQMVSEQFNNMLRSSFGGPSARRSGITFRISGPPPVQVLRQLEIPETRQLVAGARCGDSFAVYGVAAFCPYCGRLESVQTFIKGLDDHQRGLELLGAVNEQTRTQYADFGVTQRAHEAVVKDGIGLLEALLKDTFLTRVPAADHPRDLRVFQRLNEAADLILQHLGIDLRASSAGRWDELLVTAAKRHVLVHNNGIVDGKFLERVPKWHQGVGERLVVKETDAMVVLDDLRRIASALS